MNKDTGGSAFPYIKSYTKGEHISTSERHRLGYHAEGNEGMTLRDWFAGQALIGYIGAMPDDWTYEDLARKCGYAADAMIAERNKP
jgi:hypothetical protein